MSVHEQFADDLALYAMGALEAAERVALEKHLNQCAACRRELQELQRDTALLALSAPSHTPPPQARQRLMSAVAAEPRVVRTQERREWWMLIPSMAAVAIAVIAIALWRHNVDMQRQLADLQKNYSHQQEQLQSANEVLATLTDPDATRFTLTTTPARPQPQGKAIYARNRRSLIFLASNMPALPPQKAYELWLIPTSGAPIPAGVFKPDAKGSATVVNPPLPAGVEAKTFAVTVEPESGSPAPTSPLVMVASGS
jgi:anti-sigma-K factor RskA